MSLTRARYALPAVRGLATSNRVNHPCACPLPPFSRLAETSSQSCETDAERLVSNRITACTEPPPRTQSASNPSRCGRPLRRGCEDRTNLVTLWRASEFPNWATLRITWDTVLCLEGWPPSIHGDARKRAMAGPPLSVVEIAERWACCQETVRRRLRDGVLPILRIGQGIYVRADYLAQHEQNLASLSRTYEK